jgi:hypothetical protein
LCKDQNPEVARGMRAIFVKKKLIDFREWHDDGRASAVDKGKPARKILTKILWS